MEGQAPAVSCGAKPDFTGTDLILREPNGDGGAPCELERLMHGAGRGKIRSTARDDLSPFNPIQYEVIRMLALPENNLFAVGDDDQSIYGFRGAAPGIMLSFEKQYPDAKRVLLNQNYRSTVRIVEGAMALIGKNKERYFKEITALREPGTPIRIRVFRDREAQAVSLAEFARAYKRSGKSYGDIAVLYRGGQSAAAFMRAFGERGIPFERKGERPDLWEHFIAQDILAYLLMAQNGPDRKNLLKVMNKPKRYISRSALDFDTVGPCFRQLKAYYRCRDMEYIAKRVEKMEKDIQKLHNMRPSDAARYIEKEIGYAQYLREYAAMRRIDSGPLFQTLRELEEEAAGYGSLKELLSRIKGPGPSRREEQGAASPGDCVSLMTMHASKGLEFPVVFIVDANEGNCPHKRALLSGDTQEERRIFYVAMTRARDRLYIGCVLEENGRKKEKSRFLSEIKSGSGKRDA